MIRTLLAAAALVPLLSGCAVMEQAGAKPPAGLSWYVISQINDFYNDPQDPTNRPPLVNAPPAGVLRAVDVNGDGVNDWVVDWPDETQFCGTGGCRYTVYLTHGQNLVRIFDRQVLDGLTFSMAEGEARFEGSFHDLACNDARDPCRLAWGLDPATRRLVPRPSANGDTYSSQPDQAPIQGSWAEED